MSSKELTRYLKETTGKNVSPRFVRKTLTAAGLGGYVAVRKPMLRKRNKHNIYGPELTKHGRLCKGEKLCSQMRKSMNYLETV